MIVVVGGLACENPVPVASILALRVRFVPLRAITPPVVPSHTLAVTLAVTVKADE